MKVYWDSEIMVDWIDQFFYVDWDACWTLVVDNKLGMGIPAIHP